MTLPEYSKTNVLTKAVAIAVASTAMGVKAMPVVVTNGNDMGEGSLRAALESGAREIVIDDAVSDIMITMPLEYADERPLAIYGTGQTIKTMDDFTLLEISNGASATISSLTFEGPGGFNINSQSEADAPGKGIFVDVRDNQNGRVQLALRDVTVKGVANHGVHISDCDLADDCGGGGGGAGGGSSAGIGVEFINVTIEDVGNGKFDADGLRVDERANGNIIFVAHDSTFVGVGADGVELDEGQNGDVTVTVTNSTFDANGLYCDPSVLEEELAGFLEGQADEAEFDEADEILEEDLKGPVDGSSDDSCFEYEVDLYDSGFVEAYEYGIDVDDGFDIDEAGNGDLRARVFNTSISDNFDEGLDFDEEDNGLIKLVSANSNADENVDDGFKLSEEDSGLVEVVFVDVSAESNGGKGFVFEEANQGNLDAMVDDSSTSGNDGGDVGIEAVQEDQGSGTLTLTNTDVDESEDTGSGVLGVEVDGVDVVEN